MRLTLLALALILVAGSANAAVMIGKTGKVDRGFVGCKTKDNMTRLKSLIRADDPDAARKYAVSKIPDCMPIPTGTVGLVEDASGWSGDTCLRPRGEPECFWMPSNFIVDP